jgi:hypothetical protein
MLSAVAAISTTSWPCHGDQWLELGSLASQCGAYPTRIIDVIVKDPIRRIDRGCIYWSPSNLGATTDLFGVFGA